LYQLVRPAIHGCLYLPEPLPSTIPTPYSHLPPMAASHGYLYPYSGHAIAHHLQPPLQEPSIPSQHPPSLYVHPAQSLGIDFESTRIHLLALCDTQNHPHFLLRCSHHRLRRRQLRLTLTCLLLNSHHTPMFLLSFILRNGATQTAQCRP